MTTIFLNYRRFIQNLFYYAITSKFINMFPNIKRTRSQIMNHMKYIYTQKSQEYYINDKFNCNMFNAL
jgi:hypothetical protein